MQKVLITGCAGFIGSNTAEAILAQFSEVSVIGLDNFDDNYNVAFKKQNLEALEKNPRFVLYTTDIRDAAAVRAVFEKEKPDAVLHLAAKADVRKAVGEPREYMQTNIDGTLNLLECAKDFGVKRFVFASSASVYGNANKAPFKESAITDRSISPYGMSKKAGEMLAYTYHHNFGLSVLCVRIFNVYGERMRPNLVLYTWVEKMLKGESIELSGKGMRKRDFTYVGDLADALIKGLTKEGIGYEVVNVGNAKPVTLASFLAYVEKAVGKHATVVSRESHPASVEEAHAHVGYAKKLLGWQPTTPLQTGVERFVAWFKANRSVH